MTSYTVRSEEDKKNGTWSFYVSIYDQGSVILEIPSNRAYFTETEALLAGGSYGERIFLFNNRVKA